jgi:acyl-lipid omega-6 desaturase (Delta-12 desaturase)
MNQPKQPDTMSLSLMQIQEELEFEKCGKSKKSDMIDFKILDVVKTIPSECFKKNETKAWVFALANISVVILGYWGLSISPIYLLPLYWILIGTGLAGFFTIGHDCGHHSFSKNRWVNNIAGHIFLLPLLYPYHSWCIEHNCHHTRTNKLGEPGWRQFYDTLNGKADPNWQPLRKEAYALLSIRNKLIYRFIRTHFWWTGTIVNWWFQSTSNLSKIDQKDRKKVTFSKLLVLIFSLVFFPTLAATVGLWGIIKFWLIPWLIYHFWFSTFTLLHHTSPGTVWKTDNEWNAAQANLLGTIHCDYPWWVELLCHDINYHIPHHISTAIPFYNLRRAHQSLRENWKPYVRESKYSWKLIKQIISECHLYDSSKEGYHQFGDS